MISILDHWPISKTELKTLTIECSSLQIPISACLCLEIWIRPTDTSQEASEHCSHPAHELIHTNNSSKTHKVLEMKQAFRLVLPDQTYESVHEIIVLFPSNAFVTPSLNDQYAPSVRGGRTRYRSSPSRSWLFVPTSRVTARAFDGLSHQLPVCDWTHSTPAASVYMTALAEEIPIPPEPFTSAFSRGCTYLISNSQNSLGIRNDNLPSAPSPMIERTRSRSLPSHASRKSSSILSSHSGVRYSPSLRLKR